MVILRDAVPTDVGFILAGVRAISPCERDVPAGESDLRGLLFGQHAQLRAVIAENDESPVGFALWYIIPCSETGRNVLFVEAMYVSGTWQYCGIGGRLWNRLVDIADGLYCERMQWLAKCGGSVARHLAKSVGAETWDGWIMQSVERTYIEDASRRMSPLTPARKQIA